jgi:hypothetical protein
VLLPVVFFLEKVQSCAMVQPPPKFKEFKDEWGTTAREGYEDRGAFRQRRVPGKEPGSSVLRKLGGLTIVGGLCWGTYLVTQGSSIVTAMEQNHGPIVVIGIGVVTSLLGKYLRV